MSAIEELYEVKIAVSIHVTMSNVALLYVPGQDGVSVMCVRCHNQTRTAWTAMVWNTTARTRVWPATGYRLGRPPMAATILVGWLVRSEHCFMCTIKRVIVDSLLSQKKKLVSGLMV